MTKNWVKAALLIGAPGFDRFEVLLDQPTRPVDVNDTLDDLGGVDRLRRHQYPVHGLLVLGRVHFPGPDDVDREGRLDFLPLRGGKVGRSAEGSLQGDGRGGQLQLDVAGFSWWVRLSAATDVCEATASTDADAPARSALRRRLEGLE